MGVDQSALLNRQQKPTLLEQQSEEDLMIYQWRSNPLHNQYISRVFFAYKQHKHSNYFLTQCKQNQNIPFDIKFEKYIGNLTLFYAKLNFQQILYVLKCLLSGYQAIFNFFNKAIVHADFCFITKEGEIKAWINEDYRLNGFHNQKTDETNRLLRPQPNLFLSPEKWVDKAKTLHSVPNIIQCILLLVSQLALDLSQYNIFAGKIEAFFKENILRNYSFQRAKCFVNKYIYQKKIFVKSNLRDSIQKLYYENTRQKTITTYKSIPETQNLMGRVETHPSEASMSPSNNQIDIEFGPDSIIQRSSSDCQSESRKCYNCPGVKDSNCYQSTANTQFNVSSFKLQHLKESSLNNPNIQPLKESQQYKICRDRFEVNYKPLQNQGQISGVLKNFISPQFSVNLITTTSKNQKENKFKSSRGTPSSSFLSNQSSLKNKNVEFQIPQPIVEKKQTEPDEPNSNRVPKIQFHNQNRKVFQQQFPNDLKVQSNLNVSSKTSLQKTSGLRPIIKQSNISIGCPQSNKLSFTPKPNVKMVKSNCVEIDDQFKNKNSFFTDNKVSKLVDECVPRQDNNIFTMKTITRLVSSNQNTSNYEESIGDFPSKENVSSYSGLLASMGRSAQLIQLPDERINVRRGTKKQQTMFLPQEHRISKYGFKSCDKFKHK